MSARGIPVQDLLENQDESVLYNVNEQTGEVTPLVVPKKATAKKAAPKPPKEEPDAAPQGEGE